MCFCRDATETSNEHGKCQLYVRFRLTDGGGVMGRRKSSSDSPSFRTSTVVRVVQAFPGLLVPAPWIDDRNLDDAALGLLVRLSAAAERNQEMDLSARQMRSYELLRTAGYIDHEGCLADPFYQPPEPAIPQPRTSWDERLVADGSVVYYLRRLRDGAIKIGMSRRLGKRIEDLSVLYGQLDLLATEPGARIHETRRHRQFEDDRLQEPEYTYGFGASEWFRPSQRLLRHIRSLGAPAEVLR